MTDDGKGLEITLLLHRMSEGDEAARDAVFERLYDELRRVAGALLRRATPVGGTLQATALVHEAWIRLSGLEGFAWENREHFLSLAARAMRHVLVDHARRRNSIKRGGDFDRVPLDAVVVAYEEQSVDLEKLEAALKQVEERDPAAARIVECRFFGGMTMEEIARATGVSVRTVEREWAHVRAWLRRELG
jgi:RNA polymerase sigma-70 factor, ECF subfamily